MERKTLEYVFIGKERERQFLQRLRQQRRDFRTREENESRAGRIVWRRKISDDDGGIDGRGDDCGDDNDDGVCDSGLQSTLAPIFFLCCK